MKRNGGRLSRWVVLAVIALSLGMIGAGERLPPEGPLALLYDQIHSLFDEVGNLAAESDSQQDQIDQLTAAVCELFALDGNSTHPEFCGVVVETNCECGETRRDCACDPGSYFETESCEFVSFPHPDLGQVPPPKCGVVDGCRGTFTRTAPGDVESVEVESICDPGSSGGCPAACQCGCFTCGDSDCCLDCGPL